jgi:transcriptional regulator with XRE-family HTH domain
LTDISNAYLSQVERGLHEPSIRVIKSLADAFHLPTETLLGQAGLLEDEPAGSDPEREPTESAIRSDPQLTDAQKDALLAVYRSFSPAPPEHD